MANYREDDDRRDNSDEKDIEATEAGAAVNLAGGAYGAAAVGGAGLAGGMGAAVAGGIVGKAIADNEGADSGNADNADSPDGFAGSGSETGTSDSIDRLPD